MFGARRLASMNPLCAVAPPSPQRPLGHRHRVGGKEDRKKESTSRKWGFYVNTKTLILVVRSFFGLVRLVNFPRASEQVKKKKKELQLYIQCIFLEENEQMRS